MQVGDVVCGWIPSTRDAFGRILEIAHFEDGSISRVVIEDFPTIGESVQFVTSISEINSLKVIDGSGLPAPKWHKEGGIWKKRNG